MKPIITQITDDWIKKNDPCRQAIKNWWDKKERSPIKILELLIEDKKYDWANWFIVRIMKYTGYVAYAVYAAESVINFYEKKYPDDKRPRKAIEAGKKCIKDPSKKNKAAARAAARAAADAAAGVAAYAAAYAAADATYAAYAAADAADAAARAAAGVAAGVAAGAAMQLKILEFGMELLIK